MGRILCGGRLIDVPIFLQRVCRLKYRRFRFWGVILGNWQIGVSHWKKDQR